MNDPRATAYALNEMQGVARDQFERDLAADLRLQNELQGASDMADALGQIWTVTSEGLEPQAREKLLRAIAANQEAFRSRRKIVRFAVPVSLAAAASIAVLLVVPGGKTTWEPAVAAASKAAPVVAETGGGDVAAQAPVKMILLSDTARVAREMQLGGTSNSLHTEVRERFLRADEGVDLLGIGFEGGSAGHGELGP